MGEFNKDQSQADQTRYRSVLEKIQGLLQDALS